VLLFAVLTCIPDDEDQHQIVAELARVLRPGGLLIVSDYLLQNDPRNVTRYEEFASESGVYGTFRLSDGGIVRHHSQEHMSELLSGFNTKDWITIDAKTMNGNPARVTQIWGTKKYLG
jgi:SAM-dependent methyltransferase